MKTLLWEICGEKCRQPKFDFRAEHSFSFAVSSFLGLCFFSYGPAFFLILIQKEKKKKKKKKQNQKVMLLDENLRNGGSVKTGIKQQQKQENS